MTVLCCQALVELHECSRGQAEGCVQLTLAAAGACGRAIPDGAYAAAHLAHRAGRNRQRAIKFSDAPECHLSCPVRRRHTKAASHSAAHSISPHYDPAWKLSAVGQHHCCGGGVHASDGGIQQHPVSIYCLKQQLHVLPGHTIRLQWMTMRRSGRAPCRLRVCTAQLEHQFFSTMAATGAGKIKSIVQNTFASCLHSMNDDREAVELSSLHSK